MGATSSSEEMEKAHFTFIWSVESCFRADDLNSPTFTVQSLEMTEWRLRIRSYSSSARLWIGRAKEDGGPESIEIEFELSILDDGGSSLGKKSGTENFQKGGWSSDIEFIKTDALFDKKENNYFLKDALTVRCRMWRKGTELSKSELCFARTRFDAFQLFCVWAVKELSTLKQGEKRTRILDSAAEGCPQLNLILSLAVRNDKEYVIVDLEDPKVLKTFDIAGKIAVLDGEGVVAFFERFKIYGMRQEIELRSFERSKLTNALLSDDVLLLRCELNLYSRDPSWSRIEDYKLMDYSFSKLVQAEKSEKQFDELNDVCPFKEKINKLKEEATFSDVSLRPGTKSFAVHKLLPSLLLLSFALLLLCELNLLSYQPSWSIVEDNKLIDYSVSKRIQSEKSEGYFDKMIETAVCPFKEMVNKFKEEATLSDVSLQAGTKSFAVHKLVLSSRSPVFRAMFTLDMREKTSKFVDIPDLDADTLGRLLSHIYGDEVTGLTWETAGNLFEAADKYELLDLKEKCSRFLKSNLSESNVCEILVLADKHQDESLRKSAQEFVQNNTEIMYSDAWKAFRESHSKLAWETAEQIIYNMKHSRL